MTARLRLLLVLSRPPVLVLLVLYAAIGLAAGGHRDDPLLALRVLLPIVACQLFCIAVNDLADEAIDHVNLPGDRRRPLVAGGAGRREMLITAAVSAVVSVGTALTLGFGSAAIAVGGLALGAAYSLRPFRLVERGAVAPVALSGCFVVLPFLLGRSAAGIHLGARDAVLIAGLSLGFIGRIVLKDFRDVRGDALFGKHTFLVRRGRARTCVFSAVGITLGTVLVVAATPHLTAAYLAATALLGAGVLWLLTRLSTETHPRREAALISTIAILGRGMLLTLLAHLSMLRASWSVPAQTATLAALALLTVGQATTMLRHGPTTRRVAMPEPLPEPVPTSPGRPTGNPSL